MKKVFVIFCVLALFLPIFVSCVDLSEIESNIEKTSLRVSKLEDAVSLVKKAYNEAKMVSKVERVSSGDAWKITFVDNSSILLLDSTSNSSLISSISRDDNNGKIIITMREGSEFSFDIEQSYPTGIITIKDTVFIAPQKTVTFSIIVNPSNAYINTNIKDQNCSISIKNINSQDRATVKNIELAEFDLVRDADGNIKEGVYSVTLRDKGLEIGYSENIEIVLRTKDKDGTTKEVSSNSITVLSRDLLIDFSIGGLPGNIKNGLVYFQLPENVNVEKLKPSFTTTGKVFVDGVEQISGVSEHDFSNPVQYTIVGENGLQKKFYVCVANGDFTLLNINSPTPNINSFQSNVTIETYYGSTYHSYSNVRIKGYDYLSWDLEKKSYEIDLGMPKSFLGFSSNSSFVFFSNHSDKTLLRNDLAFRINRDLFDYISWTPSSSFAHIILNGEYIGYYMVAETVRIDKNRINIPNIEQCPNSSLIGNYGYLLEVNDRKDGALTFVTNNGINFSLVTSGNTEIPNYYRTYIRNHVQTCENALYSSNFTNVYKNYFDIYSFVDWFIVNEIAKNCNSNFHLNCFVYFNPSDQKLHMGPIWDCTIAFGNINFAETELYYDWWVIQEKWYRQMYKDRDFQMLVKKRWIEKKNEIEKWISSKIQERANEIGGNADVNFSLWPILGKYVWPNPKGFEKRTSFQSEVDYLKLWVTSRIDWMDSEIRSW